MAKWWHLTYEPRVNMWMSNKSLCGPGLSNLINLMPKHHTRTTRFNVHHRFQVDHVMGGTKPGKIGTSAPWKEGREIGDSAKSLKMYAPPYCWKGWKTADWATEGFPYSKQWKEQSLSALLAWASDHHQDVCMPAMGVFQRVAVVQIPMVEPPLVNMAPSMASECRKHTPQQTPTHISNWVENSTLKEKLTCGGPWHNWQYVWGGIWDWDHCCGTVAGPTTPLVSLCISGGDRTTSCWPDITGRPIKGVMITVWMSCLLWICHTSQLFTLELPFDSKLYRLPHNMLVLAQKSGPRHQVVLA